MAVGVELFCGIEVPLNSVVFYDSSDFFALHPLLQHTSFLCPILALTLTSDMGQGAVLLSLRFFAVSALHMPPPVADNRKCRHIVSYNAYRVQVHTHALFLSSSHQASFLSSDDDGMRRHDDGCRVGERRQRLRGEWLCGSQIIVGRVGRCDPPPFMPLTFFSLEMLRVQRCERALRVVLLGRRSGSTLVVSRHTGVGQGSWTGIGDGVETLGRPRPRGFVSHLSQLSHHAPGCPRQERL